VATRNQRQPWRTTKHWDASQGRCAIATFTIAAIGAGSESSSRALLPHVSITRV
jgi:hypothetical protein